MTGGGDRDLHRGAVEIGAVIALTAAVGLLVFPVQMPPPPGRKILVPDRSQDEGPQPDWRLP